MSSTRVEHDKPSTESPTTQDVIAFQINDALTQSNDDNISCVQWVYYVFVFLVYSCLIVLAVYQSKNAYHFFSFMCTFASLALIFKIFNIGLFSKELCYFHVTMKKVDGTNINIPDNIILHQSRAIESISALASPMGSTSQRWMAVTFNIGSISGLSIGINGLYDIKKFNDDSIRTKNALILYTCAMFGGVLLANVPIYLASNFNRKYFYLSLLLHYIGAFLYFGVGNFSYMLYVDFDITSIVLMSTMIAIIIIWCILSTCVSRNETLKQKDGFISFISRINIITELIGGSISVFLLCYVGWLLGDEIELFKTHRQ